ncbi:acetolactate synthase AlsS [Dactylosporangium sp. NPDC049525]|uniref:acetolactate synthase AlsS n=1 Tax=Dactylosporangium sp. NPDC049525 TaxID=3154730 RepID=UPI0034384981
MGATAQAPVRSADRVVEAIRAAGVRHVFGVPGAKIDAVYDALTDSGLQVVVCRHEQNAAFMAAAVGRLTGVPGVVLVTSGPGTANLTTGLVTANTEQDPVVALCGAVNRADRLKRTHQSMDAAGLLKTVTKFTGEVDHPDDVLETVVNAFRAAATAPCGSSAVVLPMDVLAETTSTGPVKALPPATLGPAPHQEVQRALQIIRGAQRPALLVGARGADPDSCAAIRRLVSDTALPVIETFQGAGVVSHDLEDHYVGRVGLFRNQPGDVVLARADVLITVGFDQVEYDPALWNAGTDRPIVHVDSVPAVIDTCYQPAVELRGDVAATLTDMAKSLSGMQVADAFKTEIAGQRRALRAIDDDAVQGGVDTPRGLNPAALVLRLRELLDDNATVACDVGSNYIYMARHFRVYEPRHLLFSNGQQTLGVGMPWAMAASMVRPGTQVVSVSGDGGFLFSAQELETATRLGLTFTHVIMRDNSYDMVGFQEELKYGRRSGVALGDYDIVKYAGAFGAHGYRVTTEQEFTTALRQALAEDGPSIVDVPVDYSHNTSLATELHEDPFE